MTVTDAAGEQSSASIQISAASNGECLPDDEERFCRVDLTGHYNTDGISEHGDFDDGNFDDAGWAFAGDTMPAAGPATLLGVPFEFPSYAAGRLNTVEARGQSLPLAAGKYEQVELLVSAHHGSHQPHGDAQLRRRLGRRRWLSVTDWAQRPRSGSGGDRGRSPARPGQRHRPAGEHLPAHAAARPRPRAASSITLPNESRVHLFAVTLRVVPTCTQTAAAPGGETLTGTAAQ